MKKRQLFLLVFMLITVSASSQTFVGTFKDSSPKYIPGFMTQNGEVIIYSRNRLETGGYKLDLYDTSFKNIYNIEISPSQYTYSYKREERKPQGKKVRENERQLFDGQKFETWEAFVEAITGYNGSVNQLVKKESNQLWPADNDAWRYWDYGQFGAEYPLAYYVWRDDKTAWLINPEYNYEFTGEWVVVQETSEEIESYPYLYYRNYDDAITYTRDYYYLSQTLFNNDKNYEYIVPVYDESSIEVREEDRDGDGVNDVRNTFKGDKIKSFSIISDNGTTVCTFNAEPGYKFYSYTVYCIRMGGKLYLVFSQWQEDTNEYSQAYYSINKETSSIEKVAMMQMHVSPTIASHSDNITVVLSEGSKAREIDIHNVSGQLVKRIPIVKGQKSVTFSAQGITQGLNMVHASDDNNNAVKIIIK